jgi:hypothetical protein
MTLHSILIRCFSSHWTDAFPEDTLKTSPGSSFYTPDLVSLGRLCIPFHTQYEHHYFRIKSTSSLFGLLNSIPIISGYHYHH